MYYYINVQFQGQRVKVVIKRNFEREWTVLIRLNLGTSGGSFKHDNGPYDPYDKGSFFTG
jgi:hypothetical protein